MEKMWFQGFCNCPECIVIILMKTNYQSTYWYSCVFLIEENCSKGFNEYSGLPIHKWVWACRWSFSYEEKGYITHLSNTRAVKSEWRDGISKAAYSNWVGYVCPAVTSAAAQKQVSGGMRCCLGLVRLLAVSQWTGIMQWLCPVATQTSQQLKNET